jgi:hypothetical protein
LRIRSPDTSPEAEEFLLSALRRETVAERISRMRSLTATAASLSRRAIKRANPGLNRRELDLVFVEYHYGKPLAARLRNYLESGSRE